MQLVALLMADCSNAVAALAMKAEYVITVCLSVCRAHTEYNFALECMSCCGSPIAVTDTLFAKTVFLNNIVCL